jgi:hypothetical protein
LPIRHAPSTCASSKEQVCGHTRLYRRSAASRPDASIRNADPDVILALLGNQTTTTIKPLSTVTKDLFKAFFLHKPFTESRKFAPLACSLTSKVRCRCNCTQSRSQPERRDELRHNGANLHRSLASSIHHNTPHSTPCLSSYLASCLRTRARTANGRTSSWARLSVMRAMRPSVLLISSSHQNPGDRYQETGIWGRLEFVSMLTL